MNILIIFSPKVDTILSYILGIGALMFLYLFGIYGFLRNGEFGFDFSICYRAGTAFISGLDPWKAGVYFKSPFSYPPHALPILGFYNLFPYSFALILHTFVNLISITVLCYFANKWFIHIKNLSNIMLSQALCLSIIFGNPFISLTLYQGQFTLPAATAVFLSWDYLKSNRWVLSGVFLCLSTLKPQVSIFYIGWLLLGVKSTINIRVLIIGALFSFVLIIPSAITIGPITVFTSWIQSLSNYSGYNNNALGSPYVVGLESFLVANNIVNFGVFVRIFSLVALIFFYVKRRVICEILTVNVFFILSLTFIYGHDYDFVLVIMVCSFFLHMAFEEKNWTKIIFSLTLLFLFFFPNRFIRHNTDFTFLQHYRTFLILIIFGLAQFWSYKRNVVNSNFKPPATFI